MATLLNELSETPSASTGMSPISSVEEDDVSSCSSHLLDGEGPSLSAATALAGIYCHLLSLQTPNPNPEQQEQKEEETKEQQDDDLRHVFQEADIDQVAQQLKQVMREFRGMSVGDLKLKVCKVTNNTNNQEQQQQQASVLQQLGGGDCSLHQKRFPNLLLGDTSKHSQTNSCKKTLSMDSSSSSQVPTGIPKLFGVPSPTPWRTATLKLPSKEQADLHQAHHQPTPPQVLLLLQQEKQQLQQEKQQLQQEKQQLEEQLQQANQQLVAADQALKDLEIKHQQHKEGKRKLAESFIRESKTFRQTLTTLEDEKKAQLSQIDELQTTNEKLTVSLRLCEEQVATFQSALQQERVRSSRFEKAAHVQRQQMMALQRTMMGDDTENEEKTPQHDQEETQDFVEACLSAAREGCVRPALPTDHSKKGSSSKTQSTVHVHPIDTVVMQEEEEEKKVMETEERGMLRIQPSVDTAASTQIVTHVSPPKKHPVNACMDAALDATLGAAFDVASCQTTPLNKDTTDLSSPEGQLLVFESRRDLNTLMDKLHAAKQESFQSQSKLVEQIKRANECEVRLEVCREQLEDLRRDKSKLQRKLHDQLHRESATQEQVTELEETVSTQKLMIESLSMVNRKLRHDNNKPVKKANDCSGAVEENHKDMEKDDTSDSDTDDDEDDLDVECGSDSSSDVEAANVSSQIEMLEGLWDQHNAQMEKIQKDQVALFQRLGKNNSDATTKIDELCDSMREFSRSWEDDEEHDPTVLGSTTSNKETGVHCTEQSNDGKTTVVMDSSEKLEVVFEGGDVIEQCETEWKQQASQIEALQRDQEEVISRIRRSTADAEAKMNNLSDSMDGDVSHADHCKAVREKESEVLQALQEDNIRLVRKLHDAEARAASHIEKLQEMLEAQKAKKDELQGTCRIRELCMEELKEEKATLLQKSETVRDLLKETERMCEKQKDALAELQQEKQATEKDLEAQRSIISMMEEVAHHQRETIDCLRCERKTMELFLEEQKMRNKELDAVVALQRAAISGLQSEKSTLAMKLLDTEEEFRKHLTRNLNVHEQIAELWRHLALAARGGVGATSPSTSEVALSAQDAKDDEVPEATKEEELQADDGNKNKKWPSAFGNDNGAEVVVDTSFQEAPNESNVGCSGAESTVQKQDDGVVATKKVSLAEHEFVNPRLGAKDIIEADTSLETTFDDDDERGDPCADSTLTEHDYVCVSAEFASQSQNKPCRSTSAQDSCGKNVEMVHDRGSTDNRDEGARRQDDVVVAAGPMDGWGGYPEVVKTAPTEETEEGLDEASSGDSAIGDIVSLGAAEDSFPEESDEKRIAQDVLRLLSFEY